VCVTPAAASVDVPHLHHLETFATIFISVIPIVGISLATRIAVHAGNGGLM
jgi:hypothetical protein